MLSVLLCVAVLLAVGCNAQTNPSAPSDSSNPSSVAPSAPNANAEYTAYKLHEGRKVGFVDAKTAAAADAEMTALFEQSFDDMQNRADAPLEIDIFTLEESFSVRRTLLPTGETANAYVYIHDKKPVVQDGKQGRVSPITPEQYDALAKLFERKGTIRYIREIGRAHV